MKINIFCLLITLIACCANVCAQDIMYKTDGTKDSVKVEEVTPDEIVYRKYHRAESPLYRIKKNTVLLIEYADGSIEVYNGQSQPVSNSVRPVEDYPVLGRNIISLNYLNILNGNLHLGYERIAKTGFLGVKLSVNAGVDDVGTDLLAYYRVFTSGLDLNFYPTGQGKIRYFLGPAFRMGIVRDYYNYYMGQPQTIDRNYLSFMFNNGFYVQPTKSLYLGIQAALGIARFKSTGMAGNVYTELDGILAFNLGWRF